jgi:hypothetical protein
VPPQQRLGRDHERAQPIPRERPARRGEERPIAALQLRALDAPAEDLHLVAEDSVLELELGHAPPAAEHSDRADEHEVGEGSQGSRMLPASAVTAEPTFGSPHDTRPAGEAVLGAAPGLIPPIAHVA